MPVTTFEKSTRIRELAKINGIIIAQVFQIWDAALDTGMEWSCPECGEVKLWSVFFYPRLTRLDSLYCD